MSPAHSEKPMDMEVFSWVGVIMYLPPNQTNEQRESIKCRFNDYLDLIRPLLEEYKAHAHWAKIETPSSTPYAASLTTTNTTNTSATVEVSDHDTGKRKRAEIAWIRNFYSKLHVLLLSINKYCGGNMNGGIMNENANYSDTEKFKFKSTTRGKILFDFKYYYH